MKHLTIILFCISALFGCNYDYISNKNRRNDHWAWWIDAETKKGKWIPITNKVPNLNKGEYILFYFNGNLREVGKLEKGQNIDTIFRYNLNGKLIAYKIPSTRMWYYYQNGPIKLYYPNGKIWEEGIVQNHNYGDKWTQYYENGEKRYINSFVNDTGWIVNFYERGQLKDSVLHIKGLGDFTIKSWYENGEMKQSNEFKDSDFNGITKDYYENGQIKDSGTIKNGKWEGVQLQWFEEGQLKARNNFKNGRLDGEQFTYHKNGKIKTIGNVKNGVLSGEVKQYDKEGILISNDYFENGVKVNLDSLTFSKQKGSR